MRCLLAFCSLLLLAATPAPGQARVEYEIAFPNHLHHEAEVAATFRGAAAGRPLQVRMSRSSPGRYALHEFAKNVYNVRATDGAGRALRVTRPDPYGWEVAGHDGTVRFAYTLFGDRADGTYTGIDATHAHLNMPATFAWARGLEMVPVRVTFRRPRTDWRIATQLLPTADSATFTAPNLQWFMDSPTEISPFSLREWTVSTPGGARRVRVALHHTATEAAADSFAARVRRIVDAEVAMWGELPLDQGTYTFLVDFLPHVVGDGMEHRNSTVVTVPAPLAQSAEAGLGTIAHEFFHLWNVERLRPRALEPFDFERANMSGELWFAEGFTSYYDDLFLRRAGLWSDAQYAASIGGLLSGVLNAPGRRFGSAVEMSQQAAFVDAAASLDPTNRTNTYVSYYPFGATIGLGLDLSLRARFPGLTLDDYMRAMWREYGRFQDPVRLAPERPYTLADLRRVLGQVTRDTAWANDFFRRYVEGREALDYAPLLERAGFLLRRANTGQASLRASLAAAGGQVTVSDVPLLGGPLYSAGLSRGDRIVSLDGRPVTSLEDVRAVTTARQPGDLIAVEYEQRGVARRANLTLTENPALEVVPVEAAGRSLSPEAERFRRAWLDPAHSGGARPRPN